MVVSDRWHAATQHHGVYATGFTKTVALSKDKLEDPHAEIEQPAGNEHVMVDAGLAAAAAEYPEVEEEGQDAEL
jgi:hypothetical protein